MNYKISPFGDIWSNGIINVPAALVDKYLKIASEYQIKALLFVLRNNGVADSAQIAKALGQTASDIDDLLEFWVDEGVLNNSDSNASAPAPAISIEKKAEKKLEEKPVATKKELLAPPVLSPKDVVDACRSDKKMEFLLNQAQGVLGRTLGHSDQAMLINMVNYYGLCHEVVLMILEFYRSEKERGKSIGVAYINSMARDWAEEGICTIGDAEEKLKDIENSDRLWNEVVAITEIRSRRPTNKQREMVKAWFEDFDVAMITLASDIMKENISEPKLPYMDSILKKWKKTNIKTPADVVAQREEFEKQKAQKDNKDKKKDKLQSKPSYNLDEIKRNALNNTEI